MGSIEAQRLLFGPQKGFRTNRTRARTHEIGFDECGLLDVRVHPIATEFALQQNFVMCQKRK
jgi:hypothetical protein